MNERCHYRNRDSYRCTLDHGHRCEHVYERPLLGPTVLDFECPYCRARVGEGCTTRTPIVKVPRAPHARRTALAAAVREDA
jgi:hypothetical protein